MIRLEKINKSYPMGKEFISVLKNISMQIEKGAFVSILGASGSGKSTLMNILGCMDLLDSGTYHLEGKEIHLCSQKELEQIRNTLIGFIFQKYQLIPKYSVLQNVMLPLLIRGLHKEEACEKAIHSIGRVGLTNRLSHKPNELSGGQQQRVAIARALVTNPSLLLADEPTGALDSKTGGEILDLFQELHEEGNTIVMITHDEKVAKHSKRILHLEDGVLLF